MWFLNQTSLSFFNFVEELPVGKQTKIALENPGQYVYKSFFSY